MSEESLARRLLRLSSGGPPLVFSGRDLKARTGRDLELVLGRRVLIELPRLEEWPPCRDCDQECDGRPIQEVDGRLIAACPYDAASDEELSDDDVRLFRLAVGELCLAIRRDSGLEGDGPAEIADGLWLIGETGEQHPPSRCIFIASYTAPRSTLATMAVLKRVAGPRPITLVMVAEAELEFRLALEDAGIFAASALGLLADDPGAPFCLDPARLARARPRPCLRLRRSDRSVAFGDSAVVLPPQAFQLLLLLATEAQRGQHFVENRRIEDELWGSAATSRQVADAIRRLREALVTVVGGREQAERFVQNRPGGYRLNPDLAAIEVV